MEAFKAPTLDDALSAESEKDEDTETYALNESAQATLRDIFRDFDRNHDGKLQIPEIKVSLTAIAERLCALPPLCIRILRERRAELYLHSADRLHLINAGSSWKCGATSLSRVPARDTQTV